SPATVKLSTPVPRLMVRLATVAIASVCVVPVLPLLEYVICVPAAPVKTTKFPERVTVTFGLLMSVDVRVTLVPPVALAAVVSVTCGTIAASICRNSRTSAAKDSTNSLRCGGRRLRFLRAEDNHDFQGFVSFMAELTENDRCVHKKSPWRA